VHEPCTRDVPCGFDRGPRDVASDGEMQVQPVVGLVPLRHPGIGQRPTSKLPTQRPKELPHVPAAPGARHGTQPLSRSASRAGSARSRRSSDAGLSERADQPQPAPAQGQQRVHREPETRETAGRLERPTRLKGIRIEIQMPSRLRRRRKTEGTSREIAHERGFRDAATERWSRATVSALLGAAPRDPYSRFAGHRARDASPVRLRTLSLIRGLLR
jgi:hypothetical protein